LEMATQLAVMETTVSQLEAEQLVNAASESNDEILQKRKQTAAALEGILRALNELEAEAAGLQDVDDDEEIEENGQQEPVPTSPVSSAAASTAQQQQQTQPQQVAPSPVEQQRLLTQALAGTSYGLRMKERTTQMLLEEAEKKERERDEKRKKSKLSKKEEIERLKNLGLSQQYDKKKVQKVQKQLRRSTSQDLSGSSSSSSSPPSSPSPPSSSGRSNSNNHHLNKTNSFPKNLTSGITGWLGTSNGNSADLGSPRSNSNINNNSNNSNIKQQQELERLRRLGLTQQYRLSRLAVLPRDSKGKIVDPDSLKHNSKDNDITGDAVRM